MLIRRSLLPALSFAVILTLGAPAASSAVSRSEPAATGVPAAEDPSWEWPVHPVRVVAPFVAPAHRYGPGHRGIDLAAAASTVVYAPASGIIAFVGRVADRDLVTIDHGSGLVTTLEPVAGQVAVGDRVEPGQPIGTVGIGGHAAPGSIHFGVRRNGEYLNPLILLGMLPRAVLLPCCE